MTTSIEGLIARGTRRSGARVSAGLRTVLRRALRASWAARRSPRAHDDPTEAAGLDGRGASCSSASMIRSRGARRSACSYPARRVPRAAVAEQRLAIFGAMPAAPQHIPDPHEAP